MSVHVQAPLRCDAPKRAHHSRVSKAAAKRKRTTPPASQHKMVNGLYVHSNPPRVLNMNPSVIRQWLRGGELDKLQQVVLEGQGHKLVGEYSPDPKVRAFLKTVPAIMANIEMLHDLVSKDQLAGMQQVLEKDLQATKSKSLALCKDQSGVGLLHKAVYHDYQDIVHFLGAFNPSIVDVKDKEGRTALHYAGHCKAPEDCWALLTAAGADQNVADCKGNVAAHYLDQPEQAVLSESRQFSGAMKRFTSGKGGFVVTKANIRIWIHDRDLGRLQQMLWEGHGNKLRVETSNNPRVKRFLDAVPYIMGVIRDAHAAAVANDVAAFKKKTADPVPAAILCSKDQNGLNPLHKAAGLGHTELVEYILERNPKAANMADNDGKLPLHYAAAVKDEGRTYNLLAEATADDRALDNRGKFPGYYRLKPGEVDAAGRLRAVPDAPRTASTFPPAWDWRLLNNMTYDFGPISGHDDSLRDDSGHEAGNSTSEDSEHSKLQAGDGTFGTQSSISEMQEDSGHAEHGEIKLGPENKVNLTIDEDEGVGREIEEQEEGEEAEHGEAGDQDAAAEGTENAEAAAEEAEAAAVYQEMEAEEEGIEETSTDDAWHQETAAEGAENEEITAEDAENEETTEGDAEKEGTAADETENEETEAEGGGANGGEQLATEETTEEAADDGDAVQDAETGEREIKETEGTDASTELAGGQVDRWERGEMEDGEEVAKSPDDEGTTEDQDEASKDEEPGTRAEGTVENDAPEEQVDGNINMGHGNSNEEEGGGEVKTESKDAEIRRLIDSGNMEALAAMILNGEGYRLVGRASSDPELQGFLNNVPVYMNKIAAVHEAAREGRLRDLQAALDRRKFAVARDGSRGSLGATPVHVATLFGHTSVLRYLAGRFPETLDARDALGRTPLHYAAVVQDNQHYYNMLVGLGADTGSQDDMGNKPEYYQQNPDVLTHQQLLKDYGASMNTADILADKVPNDEVSARRDIDDPDLLETLEQCYALVRDGSRPNADTLLSRYLKRPMFDKLKLRITRMDHNLLDIIWPVTKKLPDDVIDEDLKEIIEDNGGVVVPDYETYYVFADLLQPIIKELHGLIVTYDLNTQPSTMFFEPADSYDEDRPQYSADDVRQVKVDPTSRWVVSGHIECSRNLKLYQLPACMSLSQLETIERDVLNILDPEVDVSNAISSNQQGTYYRLDEMISEGSGLRSKLDSEDLSIPLSDANYEGLLHGAHWPHGRGVYVYKGYTMAVWINVQDHVRILSRVNSTGNVGQAYERISKFVTLLNENFRFKRDPYLGFLTSRPSALGNTLRFDITLYLPKLGKEEDKLKQLCSVRYLNVRKVRDREDSFGIYNKQSLSINELQTFREFTAAVSNILQLEKNLTTNSQPQNTGGGLFNIFKKK